MLSFRSLLLLPTVLLLIPGVCRGEAKCAWINEATAGGILGGTVTVTATVNDQGEGVCEFSHQQGAVVHQLRVSVGIMTDVPNQFPKYLAQCPATSPSLRAVGNEAVICSVQDKADRYAEQVVGRVRNQAFVVSVSTSVQNDPSMTEEMRRAKVNLLAEQIAGTLF
jgi:hypothetical protein